MIAGDVLGLPVAGCKDDNSVNSKVEKMVKRRTSR